MRIRALIFLSLLALTLGTSLGVWAQNAQDLKSYGRDTDKWNLVLDTLADRLDDPSVKSEELRFMVPRLEEIRGEAGALLTDAREKAGQTKALIDALGPPPEEGKPPEPQAVREQRAKLESQLAVYDGRARQAELAITRAETLIKQIGGAQRKQLAEELATQRPLPLLPSTWLIAAPEALDDVTRIFKTFASWSASETLKQTLAKRWIILALVVLAAIILAWPARQMLLTRFGRSPEIEAPSYARRLLAAFVIALVRALLPSLALVAIVVTLWQFGAVTDDVGVLLRPLVRSIVFLLVVYALIVATFAPQAPAWRLLPLPVENSARVARRLVLLVVLLSIDGFLVATGKIEGYSPELASIYSFLLAALFTPLAIDIARNLQAAPRDHKEDRAADPDKSDEVRSSRLLPVIRLVLSLGGVAVAITALLGYSVLSRYILENLVATALIVVGLLMAQAVIVETIGQIFDPESRLGKRIGRNIGLRVKSGQLLRFWLRLFVGLSLLLLGTLAIVPLWGLSDQEIGTIFAGLTRGFEVGGVRISFIDVLVGIAIFVGLAIATRMLQRAIAEQVLPNTRLDIGVRNSIKAAVGYVGFVIAALVAVASVGLDLENLAIIAGALSVGIGFGLQAIVNNFVSGIILLVERPIKVGDWVVVGSNQGHVKRINVRATEIETFDKASVIVPNSELISGAVTNWTHKNKIGRVIVPVGVAYGSDTEKVREILLDCAKAHDRVMAAPAPYIVFANFGASSLDFELRVFIPEIDYMLSTASDLRFAIDKAFRENGIEIPFAQHDIHLRDIDRLERLLAQRGSERGGGGQSI